MLSGLRLALARRPAGQTAGKETLPGISSVSLPPDAIRRRPNLKIPPISAKFAKIMPQSLLTNASSGHYTSHCQVR